MGWNEVGQSSGGQDFLKIDAGSKVRLHVLTEEPYSYKQAFYEVLNRGAVVNDETMELVTNKKTIRTQHAFWVLTESGENKIWQMGNRLAEQVKGIFDNYGSLSEVDLVVSKTGEKKATKWMCTPVPVKIDASSVDASTLTPLEEIFLPASAEDIEKMEAGIDPSTEFDGAKLEKAQPKRKSAPVEEEVIIEEEAVVEETEEAAPEPVKKAAPAAKPVMDPKMPVVREIMQLLAKHPKYKTLQAKMLMFKKCAPGKTTVAAMTLPELFKVRNELKKA